MKTLKGKLKNFLIILGIVGVMAEGIVLRDSNKKNIYLENKLDKTELNYWDIVNKYNVLKFKNSEDSVNLSIQRYLENLSLYKKHLDLISEKDSLEEECLDFAEKYLGTLEEKKELLDKLIFISIERDLYKESAFYLDSLLSRSLDKPLSEEELLK